MVRAFGRAGDTRARVLRARICIVRLAKLRGHMRVRSAGEYAEADGIASDGHAHGVCVAAPRSDHGCNTIDVG